MKEKNGKTALLQRSVMFLGICFTNVLALAQVALSRPPIVQPPRKVPPAFRQAVARMQKATQVPLAIPTNISGKFYCYIETLNKNEYVVDLDLTASAHGDTAGSFGSIAGRKSVSHSLYGTRNYEFGRDEKAEAQPVTLVHGIRGYYVPPGRGEDLMFWSQDGYSYVAAWKSSKSDVIEMANSAILNER